MGEVKSKKLKKKGKTKKKIFLIFGVLIVGLITYGIIGVIGEKEGPISDILGSLDSLKIRSHEGEITNHKLSFSFSSKKSPRKRHSSGILGIFRGG